MKRGKTPLIGPLAMVTLVVLLAAGCLAEPVDVGRSASVETPEPGSLPHDADESLGYEVVGHWNPFMSAVSVSPDSETWCFGDVISTGETLSPSNLRLGVSVDNGSGGGWFWIGANESAAELSWGSLSHEVHLGGAQDVDFSATFAILAKPETRTIVRLFHTTAALGSEADSSAGAAAAAARMTVQFSCSHPSNLAVDAVQSPLQVFTRSNMNVAAGASAGLPVGPALAFEATATALPTEPSSTATAFFVDPGVGVANLTISVGDVRTDWSRAWPNPDLEGHTRYSVPASGAEPIEVLIDYAGVRDPRLVLTITGESAFTPDGLA